MYPKPEPRKVSKARAKRVAEKRRRENRAAVYEADGGRCRCCHRHVVLALAEAVSALDVAQIHEEPPRSQGGDPCDPLETITLCARCHQEITENRLKLSVIDPDAGLRGEVLFLNRYGEAVTPRW